MSGQSHGTALSGRTGARWAALLVLLVTVGTSTAQRASKPTSSQWVTGPSRDNKLGLLRWLLDGCEGGDDCQPQPYRHVEYEGYDGWYNNFAHPQLGASEMPLLRKLPPAYGDGTYEPSGALRPNPLNISEQLMSGPNGNFSKTGKSALLVFFGQQVVEEILDAQRPGCPPEYFNIPIPEGHRYRREPGHTELPFVRSRYDMANSGFSPNAPRQQLNEITPWLDGGLTYGTTKAWADVLRSFANGTQAPDGLLAWSDEPYRGFPERNAVRLPLANPPPPTQHQQFTARHRTAPVNRFWMLGNPRGNENPFLLTFGVMWYRWHNHVAGYLASQHPDWSGERVFNEARKWVIATHQHIVVNEWLPSWLGAPLDTYRGYDDSVDPQITHVFQSAAMRFGHTLVTSGVYLRNFSREGCLTEGFGFLTGTDRHRISGVRTCNSFWRPQEPLREHDVDRMLMGMALQSTEREDNIIVNDLRGDVFGPLDFSRRDLMAVNIQRGRDHGLPDYLTARHEFGLPPVDFDNFTTITGSEVDQEVIDRLSEVYNNSMSNVDIWAGGLLETSDRPGQLFSAIIRDQFTRIRNADRFWFENRLNGRFTDEEIERIRQLTIYDIIMSVTDMDRNDIQSDPFRVLMEGNEDLSDSCQQALEDRMQNATCRRASSTIPCRFLYPLGSFSENVEIEECSPARTYDYFSGSEASFALTFLAAFLAVCGLVGLLIMLARRRQRQNMPSRAAKSEVVKNVGQGIAVTAQERVSANNLRSVVVRLDKTRRSIEIRTMKGSLLRSVELRHMAELDVILPTDGSTVIIKVPREYDLVLELGGHFLRDQFMGSLNGFLSECGIQKNEVTAKLKPALEQVVTQEHRQRNLERFFRVVFAQAFNIKLSKEEVLNVSSESAREVVHMELTLAEFADALSMSSSSSFVTKMFAVVDMDKNGYISFREFLNMMVVFAKGTAEDKVKLMFDMYDIDQVGKLSRKDFSDMIRSLLELSSASLDSTNLDEVVNTMFSSGGLSDKDEITADEFLRLFAQHQEALGYAQLQVAGASMPLPSKDKRKSGFARTRDTVLSIYSDLDSGEGAAPTSPDEPEAEIAVIENQGEPSRQQASGAGRLARWMEIHRLTVFWSTLYTLVLLGIFAERAYYYSVEREHAGLRRIAGYGVTVTRGAASAMMFTYSTLLVTMCRNTITFCRETFLHRFIPFDSAIFLHKYIAAWALFFSLVHTVGHGINFYHISTQAPGDLTCLFRDYFRSTDVLPKFHYWCWETITGFTGVLLLLNMAAIYVFAVQYARRNVYKGFWATHNTYPFFYILTVLHGSGRLVQEPFFYYFFLGPCVLFALDRLVTASRKKVEIAVINAELLPSDVTAIHIKRPSNFEYKSGQWVRIACPVLSSSEFHPFTLSSAPHEKNLSLHIRAVGPWTRNLRRVYDPTVIRDHALPKIYLDGPYGEGHQDWYRFEVSVLVGGGIGITPFASILKDIVRRASAPAGIACKKVYFLWVTRTQKHFEWMVDIIRDVESSDSNHLMSTHIFITQFYSKFDLRTIMLYICERHFQKISRRSLFTGLRSITHFGRPNLPSIFRSLQRAHPQVGKFGVFSCGPAPMTRSVEEAAQAMNRGSGATFEHHFENF
ncbi:dual oxidase 2-like [Amphibalanus amphitrite]|uniref:dual oxidase 2-like n=1 Tax=Amphibalanus amphitrite TaxID=1232801 RepID=UPI001C91CA31|nr:dual oxidase 2-like [Amphibalanus amphitrite]